MIFKSTPVAGAFVVGQEPRDDERGIFARAVRAREFAEAGLECNFVQTSNFRGVDLFRAEFAPPIVGTAKSKNDVSAMNHPARVAAGRGL
jgi:dTDP-4-dehydrorhamnose 3,5-epimerase